MKSMISTRYLCKAVLFFFKVPILKSFEHHLTLLGVQESHFPSEEK